MIKWYNGNKGIDGGGIVLFCPKCKTRVQSGVSHCSECESALVENLEEKQPTVYAEEKRNYSKKSRNYNRMVTITCRVILGLAVGITLLTWITGMLL